MFNLNTVLSNDTLKSIILTVAILFAALILSQIVYRLIGIVFNTMSGHTSSKGFAAKTRTIKYLLRSISNAVIFGITILTILSQWGINILPLLTGVGILGLGFSLGTQTLVKDLIAGFFILLENQYNVGDMIKTDKYEGEVIKITLRLTILQDKEGNIVYLPNSLITAVTRLQTAQT